MNKLLKHEKCLYANYNNKSVSRRNVILYWNLLLIIDSTADDL